MARRPRGPSRRARSSPRCRSWPSSPVFKSQRISKIFRRGLGETGYTDGHDVTLEHTSAGGQYDRFRAIAGDLVRRQVAVIFATGGTAAALAAKSASATTPAGKVRCNMGSK